MNKSPIILAIFLALPLQFECRAAAVNDRINVTVYGATPNDGTDDTAAINSAVAAGASIYFPPGSYNYTGRITVPANKSYRIGVNISDCTFTGSNLPANENGVFLATTRDVRVSGNIFRDLRPSATGSCIVAYTGSDTVRVTDNIFDNVRNAYFNAIGASFYFDSDNIIK